MEVRKITIVSTTSNSKKVIETSAETLGELKAVLEDAGIDYSGMDFFEGVSKTKLLDNASPLPQNIPYKGATTNELVFMLTNSNKKIKSGVTSRPELYAKVKELDLQEKVKEEFGKNFTQVTSSELEAFIVANTPSPKATKKVSQSDTAIATSNTLAKPVQIINSEVNVEKKLSELKAALLYLTNTLVNEYDISDDQANEIKAILKESDSTETTNEEATPKVVSSYDNDEINNMFVNIV